MTYNVFILKIGLKFGLLIFLVFVGIFIILKVNPETRIRIKKG